jgi:hypothetical protein
LALASDMGDLPWRGPLRWGGLTTSNLGAHNSLENLKVKNKRFQEMELWRRAPISTWMPSEHSPPAPSSEPSRARPIGEVEGFAETWLPSVLGRFARAHPKVRVEVRTERNSGL